MSEPVRELDVRALAPSSRHSEIVGAFEALKPGEGFVLVNNHDPKPLLYEFQAEHAGQFEWSVLQAGPQCFRVEIRRRVGAPLRTVADFLEYDHRRLDELLLDVVQLIDQGTWTPARERFAEFSCGLNWHIDAEEHILFPAFEQLTGITGGPTAVMRADHVEIRQWMAAVTEALDAEDGSGVKDMISRLEGALTAHNVKEEQILYPATDQAVDSPRERDDLVRHLQAF